MNIMNSNTGLVGWQGRPAGGVQDGAYQQPCSGIGIVLCYFRVFALAFGPGKAGNTSCSCRAYRCFRTVRTQWEVGVKSQLFC